MIFLFTGYTRNFCWVPFLFLILLFCSISCLKFCNPLHYYLSISMCIFICFVILFLMLLLLFRVIVIRLVWKTVKLKKKRLSLSCDWWCHIHIAGNAQFIVMQSCCWYICIWKWNVAFYFIKSTEIGILICWMVHNLLFSGWIHSKHNKIIIVTK